MLKIKCDLCGAEIQDNSEATEVVVRKNAFAPGDRKGPLVNRELCKRCSIALSGFFLEYTAKHAFGTYSVE